MAMAETVNIPLLPCWAMWGRGCDTAAGFRNTPLKGVGAEEHRQIRAPSRS